jgi:hypothetical protein
MRFAVALILLAGAPAANALELLNVSVEREAGVYLMHSDVRFGVGLEPLYEIMTDWDLSTQYSSVVVESRNTGPDELGRPGFYSKNRGCLAFFCVSFERRGHVELEPYKIIRAFADPRFSDFHVCNETWRFAPDGDETVMTYELEMQPKFWVPPVVGPWLIKRKLKNDGIRALARIETVARTRAAQGD